MEISKEILEGIKLIKDPTYTKSKGRPKCFRRILSLYEKLRQLDLKKVDLIINNFTKLNFKE